MRKTTKTALAVLAATTLLAACAELRQGAVDRQPPVQSEADLAKARESAKAFFAMLGRRHAAEPADTEWANKVKSQLTQSFGKGGAEVGGRLETVDCRRSLCRVDVAFRSPTAQLQAQPKLFEWLASQPCGFHLAEPAPETARQGAAAQHAFLECAR